MTLMTLKRRQGTTTRTTNVSSNNNNDDIESMVEVINKTVASTNNSTVAPPVASSTTQPPTKKKKIEQQQLVWAKDGVDSETAELHPAYLLKNGNETCQIRWTSNGVVATVPKSRISFDLPTRRRKKSDSSKKGESVGVVVLQLIARAEMPPQPRIIINKSGRLVLRRQQS